MQSFSNKVWICIHAKTARQDNPHFGIHSLQSLNDTPAGHSLHYHVKVNKIDFLLFLRNNVEVFRGAACTQDMISHSLQHIFRELHDHLLVINDKNWFHPRRKHVYHTDILGKDVSLLIRQVNREGRSSSWLSVCQYVSAVK